MPKICPKCSADTEPLEEETTELCIHEKAGIVAALVAAIAVLLGTGTV